jgi:uncharacterized membrane protein
MSWTQSGGIVALARLSPGDITRAVAINNLGWIAGTDYNLATGVSNGVLWTSPSTVLILATNFSPTALNDDGQVVGSSGGYGAAIWTSANGVQPLSLNGLGITEGLSAAYGINDSGQIVGAVRTTPELETITLSCVGLTVLLLAKTVVAPQGTSAMITGATDKSVADLVVDSLP